MQIAVDIREDAVSHPDSFSVPWLHRGDPRPIA
jgi:hypothetical protein